MTSSTNLYTTCSANYGRMGSHQQGLALLHCESSQGSYGWHDRHHQKSQLNDEEDKQYDDRTATRGVKFASPNVDEQVHLQELQPA